MSSSEVSKAFVEATSATKYKAALSRAKRLTGNSQLKVLDDMFSAAARLGVERSTGEPIGMQQQLDGSVTVTWQEVTKRPDGSSIVTASSAVLEPLDQGSGWKSRTKDVPDEVVQAVTSAAMNNELVAKPLAKKPRRVYVR
jgi:hypothetical protein